MAGVRFLQRRGHLSAWLDLALLLALLIGAVRVCRESRSVQANLSALNTTEPASEIGEHQSLAGLDANGQGANRYLRTTDRHAVVFVVRAARYRADIDYWNAVAVLLKNDSLVWLLGYCDGSACNAMTEADAIRPEFDLVGYGELDGLETAHDADAGGFALVTDNRGTITSRTKWRAESPTAAAAYFRSLK